jgi:hypothetical protein
MDPCTPPPCGSNSISCPIPQAGLKAEATWLAKVEKGEGGGCDSEELLISWTFLKVSDGTAGPGKLAATDRRGMFSPARRVSSLKAKPGNTSAL